MNNSAITKFCNYSLLIRSFFSEQLASFHQVRKQDMVEAGIDVSFHEIDMVLAAPQFELRFVFPDRLCILFLNPGREDFEILAAFKIDKTVRAVLKFKIEFLLLIHHMKQYHFMLVMLQVLQGMEKFFGPAIALHHVAENDHQRPLVGQDCSGTPPR